MTPGERWQVNQLLLELVSVAAQRQALVNLEQLRRLARNEPRWRPLTARLSRLLTAAVREGALLSEARHRLTRTGEPRELRVYRLNPRYQRRPEIDQS